MQQVNINKNMELCERVAADVVFQVGSDFNQVFSHGDVTLVQSDCLKMLAALPDDSVDLIATDPPYFRVKAEEWDNQWDGKADFFAWLDLVLVEMERVLKPTGSLYLFCGPYLAAETELLIAQRFGVLNHISWRKPSGRHLGCSKESLTKFFPQTERIIFAESRKKKPFHYEAVRSYLANTLKAAGVTSKLINEATGTKMSGHWLGKSQFSMPSPEHYKTLQRLAPALKSYNEIRSQYVSIRKVVGGTGRYFGVTKHVPYTDVWDFSTVHPYPGKHPCEKPLQLMDHILIPAVVRVIWCWMRLRAVAARQYHLRIWAGALLVRRWARLSLNRQWSG